MSGRLRAAWSVVAGTVAVVVLRAVLSTQARYPRVVADEAAYLAMARLLGGGERWNLGLASTYGPAYSALLAPWFALGLSPDAVYRAAIVTNIVLAGLTFLALEALARRIPGVTRPLSSGLALVAASLPALVATTNLAWSDDLAPLVFALLVLALLDLVARPRPLGAGLLVVVAVVGYAVHGRFLPLAPVVLGVVVVLGLARRLRWPVVAAAGAGLVVGLAAVQLASQALYDRLYDPGQVTQGLNEADRIGRLGPLVMSTTGQLWYLLVTTAGVAGIGGLALMATSGGQLRTAWAASADDDPPAAVAARWRRLLDQVVGRRFDVDSPSDDSVTRGDDVVSEVIAPTRAPRPTEPSGPPAPLATAACVALVALALATSIVFMTDRPRGDHMVYGRYNDLFVGPLVLCGLAVLAVSRDRVRTAVLAGLALVAAGASAVVLWRYRQGLLSGGYLVYPVLGLVALDHEGPPALPGATVVAVVLGVGLAGLAVALPGRARPVAVVAVTAALCVVGSARAVDRIDPSGTGDPRGFALVAEVLGPGDRLAWVASDPAFPIAPGFYRDQLYTPDIPSVRLAGTPWEDGEPFLVTGATHPGPAAAGYRLAWVDPGSALGLWVAPGPRQDALAADDALLPAGGLVPPPGGDRGTIRLEGPVRPTAADGADALSLRVVVENTSAIPWATATAGGDATGRVRIGVLVHLASCTPGDDACPVADRRADIGRWVPVDDGPVTVDVVLPLDLAGGSLPTDPDDLAVTVQLLREGASRFGPPVTARPG